VLDDRGVLLGWLSLDALRSDPAAGVTAVMLEGPVTFRPNMGIAETASWMDASNVGSILITSSGGTFLGVVRRQDLDVAEPAGARAEA
jgi:predicted transcriptional regulator